MIHLEDFFILFYFPRENRFSSIKHFKNILNIFLLLLYAIIKRITEWILLWTRYVMCFVNNDFV